MPARFFLFLWIFISFAASAQTDSLRRADSLAGRSPMPVLHTDTLLQDTARVVVKKEPLLWHQDTAFNKFFINKNFPKNKQSVFAINAVRQPSHEDTQFYMLIGLLLFIGIVRALFPKYFATLFQSFSQSSQRNRQSKENMAQDALPSFLMNLVFVFSGGLLLAAFLRNEDYFQYTSFPLVWVYTSAILAGIYLAKSFFITLFGWAFEVPEAAGNYRFIVFLVNKVAGLCFIPLLLILLYATGDSFKTAATLALVIIVALLLYRYVVSLTLVGKKLKIHPLHFFLYLCAVEILPLLITYKVLLITKEL